LREPRKRLSVQATKALPSEKRLQLLAAFGELSRPERTRERLEQLKERARRFMEGDEDALDEDGESGFDTGRTAVSRDGSARSK
jgi:hypothetical protein